MFKAATSLLISVFLFFSCIQLAGAQQLSQYQKDSLLQNRVVIPGGTVSLIPPAYFKPFVNDGRFGFMHEGAAASISVELLEGAAFTLVTSGITPEYLSGQHVEYHDSEDLRTRQGYAAKIFTVGFMVRSKDGSRELPYERLMFFTGDDHRTVWINANYPVVAKTLLSQVIRECLLSVEFAND